jgi:hypothetical protein
MFRFATRLKNLNSMRAAGFTTDLHNFAFLGKNPYLGGASDWVWFNVPHGPQKQIDSFVSALLACKAGKETVRSTTNPLMNMITALMCSAKSMQSQSLIDVLLQSTCLALIRVL